MFGIMASVPNINRQAIVAAVSRQLPSAIVSVETINPEHDSWVIDVRHNNRVVSVSWGPLSGFGGTDHQALRNDSNPFGAYDWPLETIEQAVEFVVRRLMAIVPEAVPEAALDYDEILRRGGANGGDEDFALCKCPHCHRVYLVEYEVDTLYLDPANLDRRVGINIGVSGFRCEGCGGEFPERTVWIGPKAPEAMQVTWQDLAESPWRWVAARSREGAAEQAAAPDRDGE